MNDKSDKELANSVVALGIGGRLGSPDNCKYCVQGMDRHLRAEPFVRDWRVAGALLERVHQIPTKPVISIEDGQVIIYDIYSDINIEVTNESLPRAIIEACVEALS